ncbi:MAG TPA: discoidin domain-containing protein [Arachidicoccus soli]|nr:discoidin domain-containing protein [Arachidicoccus soli]
MLHKCTLFIITLSFLLFGQAMVNAQSKISLNSQNNVLVHWKLTPQSAVKDSLKIFQADYNDNGWVKATVPGAVFTSYVNDGLEKDPNYGDNIYKVDKSKYNRNFWYRTLVASPQLQAGKTVWLNFKGINRKGEIFFNGKRLGLLNGFMEQGRYDVTKLLNPTGENVIAVLVYWPTLPVPNYASPTYISSDGWDWMPSVPGLLQGITDDVYFSITGNVTIQEPWIRTEVDTASDEGILSVHLDLKNNSPETTDGLLKMTIQPGNISIQQGIKIAGNSSVSRSFDSTWFKQMIVHHPKLWWPNGYGKPNLYSCHLSYEVNGKVSDVKDIKFGIRQYSYDTLGGVLHININGRRIFVKGGNWGMSEYLLRCRGDEYDTKVKLHQQMHLNMIRNWIGSTTDDAFYDACDKYGIMVWDDFWLNSHPNLPRDIFAFNKNAVDKIIRFRNHPSIAVWCGDNEGVPLAPLNGWLREDVKTFDGSDRLYQPNSHAGALTGSGPWTNFDPEWYFTKSPSGFGGSQGWGFRTEIGTAVFTTFGSFKKFMPKADWWPRDSMWNKHFFGKSAGNASPDHYFTTVNNEYGKASGIEDFCRKAQLVNIQVNKALYEGWQQHMWNDASGVMTWMSQSAYPSFVWQTYDYYYDLNGAYWGVRKACEPVHIQWDCADNSVKLINTTLKNYTNLKAISEVYNLDGTIVPEYGHTAIVNLCADTIASCFTMNFKRNNLAYKHKVFASSTSADAQDASSIVDGSKGSRWSSTYSDNQWVYVDLGTEKEIASVNLIWESAYAKAFKLQVSNDAIHWKDIYASQNGSGGDEHINFSPVKARYVKMLGIKRASQWGYSLYEFEIFGKKNKKELLTSTHFIRLLLEDAKGKILSKNFYWNNTDGQNYTALNHMGKATLKVSSAFMKENDSSVIKVQVANPKKSKAVAFAIHVQAYNAENGERILPAIMNDDYFTLMQGESKTINIAFKSSLLPHHKYYILAEPFNNK